MDTRMLRAGCAVLVAVAATALAAVPAGADPGVPVWRYDYGIEADLRGDLVNVTSMGVGTDGRIDLGYADHLDRVTGTGEHVDTLPVASSVLASTSDGVVEFLTRTGSASVSVVDANGNPVDTWPTPAGWSNPTLAALTVSSDDPLFEQEVVFVASTDGHIAGFDTSGNVLQNFDSHVPHVTGLTVTPNGALLVLDGPDGFVQRISSQGIRLTRFGSTGSGDGQFTNASGIAADSAGTVFVADTGNYRIDLFSARGQFLDTFGSPQPPFTGETPPPGYFTGPTGVVVDCAGRLHVLDVDTSGAHPTGRVSVYTGVAAPTGSCAGPPVTSIPVKHAGKIAVDAADNLFVATAAAVEKYDVTGQLVTSWVSSAKGDAHWDSVAGLAAAPSGDVYLLDDTNERVLEFHSTGTFVRTWDVKNGGAGSIAVRASDGHVLVAVYGSGIAEYTPTGQVVRTITLAKVNGQTVQPIFVGTDGDTTLVAAWNELNGQGAVERFDQSGSIIGSFAAPTTDAARDAIIAIAPAASGGYLLTVEGTSANALLPDTFGLVAVSSTGTPLNRIIDNVFPARRLPGAPAVDCAGRVFYPRTVPTSVVRLNTATPPCTSLPSATTGKVTSHTATSLTVKATVNPSGQVTKVRVQYGTTTAYGHQTSWVTLASDNVATSRSILLSGLTAGTVYHYRVQAKNASGSVNAADRTGTPS